MHTVFILSKQYLVTYILVLCFSAADIKDLKIIESRAEPAEQTHSTVAVTKGLKKVQRATVCENLQANPTSSGMK